jgi:hypothetical protein
MLPRRDPAGVLQSERPVRSKGETRELVEARRREHDPDLGEAVVPGDDRPQTGHGRILGGPARYDGAVRTIVWIPLLVSGVAVVGGLTAAAVQGLAAWRAFRRFRHAVGDGLLDATRRLAEAERRLAHTGEKAAELDRARVRLQRTLAIASVLTGATGEAWGIVGRARGFVPRK